MTKTGNGRLLFLHALTGLHPGTGTALGAVDLPVQRERHTQWPTIPASSLKGVLRDSCREKIFKEDKGEDRSRNKADEDATLKAIFGPPRVAGGDDAFAGTLSLTDARILAFPVRSLKGVFAWVTCRAVLELFNRDAAKMELPKAPGCGMATGAPGCDLWIADHEERRMVLEEFDYVDSKEDLTPISSLLAASGLGDNDGRNRFQTHLVLLPDDDFTYFVRHATEVTARTSLDYDNKTVKNHHLFYEEFLPAETLFYSVMTARDSRSASGVKTFQKLEEYLGESPVLQLGAGETIGKGFCEVFIREGVPHAGK